ncbi:MAG: UDP-N-acetylmuramoyl-tripeptide--D-alanyl-D-alanine ligase [Methylophilaceae bacterium]
MNISLKKIIEITKGSFLGPKKSLEKIISSITIDSRSLKKSDLFISIVGKNFDGNQFTKEALNNGSKFAIISNPEFHSNKTILVESGKKALADIASYLRNNINPKVIAITGSNGKTSTKEVLVSIMNNYLVQNQLLFTEANFNNDIGLPLTLIKLENTHSHVVLELGMNHSGEIAELTKIAKPHIALITNIGEAHIQNFNSKDDIAKAKKELLDYSDNLEISILPRDDDYYKFLATNKNNSKQLTFGFTKEATINGKILDNHKILISTPEDSFEVKINLLGKQNIKNILAACCLQLRIEYTFKYHKKRYRVNKTIPWKA